VLLYELKKGAIMTTKFSIKSILAVSLVLIMSSTASAYVYKMINGQIVNCTLSPLCSIQVEGLLKGLGNVTNNTTFFTVSILIQEGTMVFLNPAGNSKQANGVPFGDVFVELTETDLINAGQVTKNGSALSEIIFHDADMIDAIVAALQAQCLADPNSESCDTLNQINTQNQNWLRLIVVTRLQVLGQQFTNNNLEDALGQQCEAPNQVQANPKNFVGVEFTYGCTEECHNKTGPQCPLLLPLQ
jgi:hypothetical protein